MIRVSFFERKELLSRRFVDLPPNDQAFPPFRRWPCNAYALELSASPASPLGSGRFDQLISQLHCFTHDLLVASTLALRSIQRSLLQHRSKSSMIYWDPSQRRTGCGLREESRPLTHFEDSFFSTLTRSDIEIFRESRHAT